MALAIRVAAWTLLIAAALPGAAGAQTCTPDGTPDWMAAVPLTNSSAPIRPVDCATVIQTPPDFSWPDLSSDAQYQVSVTYPDGHTRTLTAPQNWINWDEVLPAGNYAWVVQASNANGTQSSRTRRFTVDSNAVAFLVPDWAALFNRAAQKPHPRALPDPATAQAMVGQRQTEMGMLLSQVDSLLDAPVQVEPTSTSAEAVAAQIGGECQRTLKAALAWLVTGDPKYFSDAVRRAQNLISWDPRGSTGYANVQEASGVIAGTLALVYDWLYPWLDANQRSLLLPPILARGSDMYNYVIGSRARVAIYPYDSHGNLSLNYLALISVLLAGDLPQAQGALRDSLPLALHWTSPWGGEDGGFGNGTAYATWTTGNLLIAWYALNWTVGVDLQQKAWVRNYGNFLAYFIPPATPAGLFGDGAELALTEAWARFGKAYTRFAPGPLGRWYAAQLSGEDPTALELLLAPPAASGPAPYPAGTPDGALFPSIGWAAMHSSLSDPARVSVYFRSSPFGSYNHSHADQNSFVVNAGGQALAIETGYYDGYQTPHWSQWYKQTRAQNAITFDGGQGQVIYENGGQHRPGAITSFVHQPGYDIVQGDATQSYGGALSNAARAIVYLRPNLILVYDNLASDTARQWEWNIHALQQMTVLSDQSIAIQNNGQSLCVDMLAGPPLRFTQSSQFTADPGSWLAWTPQWHGTFASTGSLGSAEFIALLRVGCAPAASSASKTNGVWTVQAGANTVTISDGGAISVQ